MACMAAIGYAGRKIGAARALPWRGWDHSSFTILPMVRLENVLASWKTIRQDTAQAVEDLPPANWILSLRPIWIPFARSPIHILNAGNGLSGMLLDGEENLTGPEFREKMKKHFSDPSRRRGRRGDRCRVAARAGAENHGTRAADARMVRTDRHPRRWTESHPAGDAAIRKRT